MERVATATTSRVSTADFQWAMCLRIFLVGLAQERILTRTNVGQTAIVQLDVIIRTNEYATAIARSRVFEVLQIDVVTLFIATADTDVREFGDVCYLSQEKQATLHLFYIDWITHIDVTMTRAERCIARLVLELDLGTSVHNDVTTATSIQDQVALITVINQARIVCRSWVRAVFEQSCIGSPFRINTAGTYTADDTRVFVILIRTLTVVERFVRGSTADVFTRIRDGDRCVMLVCGRHVCCQVCEIDVTALHALRRGHCGMAIVPTSHDVQLARRTCTVIRKYVVIGRLSVCSRVIR